MSKQTLKVFILTVLTLATLSLIGTTYAYFQAIIVENKEDESLNIKTEMLSIEYIDGTSEFSGLTEGYVFPGETFSKTFTVKNTGTASVKYNIILTDVVNTFTRTQDWTYVLMVGDLPIARGEFPTETKAIIYPERELTYQSSETYTLIISYANTNSEEQKIDWNPQTRISAKIDIEGV